MPYMRKESVLFVANFSSDTGYAWKFIYKLFNVIARNLYDKNISICLSFARIVEPITILDNDIPFHAFVFDPGNVNFKSLLDLRREIKQQNIKYVYLTDQGTYDWLYALLRLWGVKKIVVHSHVSVQSPDPALPETGMKKLKKTILNNIKFLAADSIYVPTDFVKDRTIRKACYPAKKITKIIYGIDIDAFNISPKKDVGGNNVHIFMGSRATKYKGVYVLIDAIKLLRDHYSINNFSVEYAGDGPDIDEFKKMVSEFHLNDKFTFLGQLEGVKKKICNADIIVVPSIWGDASPFAVIEAMAAGKSLVATKAGGIPEEVGDDGCASLVPHSNSKLLAKELAELILDGDKRKRMGKKARKRAENMFREDVFHKKVVECVLRDFGV